MKLCSYTGLIAALLSTASLAEEEKLADAFPLDKVTQFVFVNEVPVGDDFGYEETKLKGESKGTLADALADASLQPYITEMDYPFIGILARVMLLDREREPICTMQVVNWNRTVVFRGVIRKDGANLIDERYANIKSDALARWVYDQVRTRSPEDLKRMQEWYAKVDRNLETLLFPEPTKT
ncbi:MAG: hypothetical protein P1V20_25350 [Verrucomicrobiales bacterium]|nr:hypothetical protein [Verrucomicrobiales bacterium]